MEVTAEEEGPITRRPLRHLPPSVPRKLVRLSSLKTSTRTLLRPTPTTPSPRATRLPDLQGPPRPRHPRPPGRTSTSPSRPRSHLLTTTTTLLSPLPVLTQNLPPLRQSLPIINPFQPHFHRPPLVHLSPRRLASAWRVPQHFQNPASRPKVTLDEQRL